VSVLGAGAVLASETEPEEESLLNNLKSFRKYC